MVIRKVVVEERADGAAAVKHQVRGVAVAVRRLPRWAGVRQEHSVPHRRAPLVQRAGRVVRAQVLRGRERPRRELKRHCGANADQPAKAERQVRKGQKTAIMTPRNNAGEEEQSVNQENCYSGSIEFSHLFSQ